jgi:hypothetical protein
MMPRSERAMMSYDDKAAPARPIACGMSLATHSLRAVDSGSCRVPTPHPPGWIVEPELRHVLGVDITFGTTPPP